jgi:hypothetical protein
MNKYVIEYETGDYDSWTLNQYAIEAESKEAIRLHLQKAIDDYLKERKEERAIMDQRASKSYDAWLINWAKFIKRSNPYAMNVNGMKFGNADDVCLSEHPLEQFRIYTLDEWFEQCRPDPFNEEE